MFKQFEDYLAANSKIATTYVEKLDNTLKDIQNSDALNQFYQQIPWGSKELSEVRKEILKEIDNTPMTALERREKIRQVDEEEWKEVRSVIRKDYKQAQKILVDKYFKKLLYQDLTPDVLKVADLVFARAWDEGEEGGLTEVEDCFVELIKFVSAILTKSKEN